jgi:dihydrofolate synthase/folylpolyglutamate synthase
VANSKHHLAHQAADEDALAQQALREVYREIMSRNPEHEFDPTLVRVRRVLEMLGDPQLLSFGVD